MIDGRVHRLDAELSQDLQSKLLGTIGLLGIGLAAICKSWAAAVAGRQAKEWKVLDRGSLRTYPGNLGSGYSCFLGASTIKHVGQTLRGDLGSVVTAGSRVREGS